MQNTITKKEDGKEVEFVIGFGSLSFEEAKKYGTYKWYISRYRSGSVKDGFDSAEQAISYLKEHSLSELI